MKLQVTSLTLSMPGIKFSHFNFILLRVILHALKILIVLSCCHGNLLFPVCPVIFCVEK